MPTNNVAIHVPFLRESLATELANVWFLSSMLSHVYAIIRQVRTLPSAELTFDDALPCVEANMTIQARF